MNEKVTDKVTKPGQLNPHETSDAQSQNWKMSGEFEEAEECEDKSTEQVLVVNETDKEDLPLHGSHVREVEDGRDVTRPRILMQTPSQHYAP